MRPLGDSCVVGERGAELSVEWHHFGCQVCAQGPTGVGRRAFSSAGKDLQRQAEAGLIEVGEETSLRAAIGLLCGRRTESRGRPDSAARMGIPVDRKQLLTHHCTGRQLTFTL